MQEAMWIVLWLESFGWLACSCRVVWKDGSDDVRKKGMRRKDTESSGSEGLVRGIGDGYKAGRSGRKNSGK